MNSISEIQSRNLNPPERSRERRLRIALAAGTGLLFALSFPPIPTGLAAFVALVPLLFLIERLPSWGAVFRFSYLAFLVGNAGTIWWISGWWGEDPWLKLAGVIVNFIHPLLLTPPLVIYFFLRKRLGFISAAVSFPFLWTSWEWLLHLPELSFPWLVLANTQTYDTTNIQFISWTGAFGLSFWIVLINTVFFVSTRQLLHGIWSLRSRRMAAAAVALVLLILLPKIHSAIVLNDPVPAAGQLRVGIIQPNIDPYDKWDEGETPMQKLQQLMHIYDSLAAEDMDVMLLPETAIPFRILQPTYAEEWRWLRTHVDSVGIPLLAGFPHTVWYDDPETAPGSARRIPDSPLRYHDFNSALLMHPAEMIPQIYHKSRLTPLSERIPYLDALPFLQDALTWGVGISNWGLGNDTTVFRLRTEENEEGFWAMICYETLYPSFVAGFAKRGAEAFGVITNDGWFGHSSGPYQLMQYTVLRAVENRRAVARCANNGISCFIDPYGRVRQKTGLYTRTGIMGSIPLIREQTFYTRHGDWFPGGATVIAGFFVLFSIIVRYYRK
ncbi:MAG: apolipoprotein N-acyltransferase [Bacteroidetes bacterium]|nr:apolipoprotein N-acyltransferase [Bacteroidota bacterium]